MRDPRHFVRTAWIVFHALWSMTVLLPCVLISSLMHDESMSSRDEYSTVFLALGSIALLGALLGAGRAWVLRRSAGAIGLSGAVSSIGVGLAIAAFGGMFAVCVGVFGEESLVSFLIASCAGSACLALAQTLVERPMFARFGVRFATTIVGFTSWIFGFAALTRGADVLGLSRNLGTGQASWPVIVVLGGVAGAVLGAITALALPRTPRTDDGKGSLSSDAGVGRAALVDEG